MESDTSSADEADKPPPLPAKHYNLFSMESLSGCYPVDIFEGKMGPLPLFLAVNVGYDPEEEDPFMYPYESGEIMFAYKEGHQKRVLLQDGKMQTWSLPVTSSLQFHTDNAKDSTITLPEVLESEDLPAPVYFSQPQRLKFTTRHISSVPKPYPSGVKLTKTYYEPYYWCLSISGSGAVADKPVVLPRNLHEVCFSKIISVTGAADPEAKVAEFIEHYSRIAEEKSFQGDPFFQELALVCRGPQPVETVQPYMTQDTFFNVELLPPRAEVPPVRKFNKPLPSRPDEALLTLPPRPHGELRSNEDDEASGGTYSALNFDENNVHLYGDGNVYQEPRDLGVAGVRDKPSTQIVKPLTRVPSRELASDLIDKPRDGTPNPLSTGGRSSNLSDHPLSMKSGSDGVNPGGEALPHSHDPLSMAVPRSTLPKTQPPPPKLPPRRRGVALKSMTIDDVSAKLKELGLRKKLVKKFHDQRIDGVLLEKLEERTLKTEFGMSHVEFLLLHTFITEGHIPQSGPRTA